jgi:hypothetical protein
LTDGCNALIDFCLDRWIIQHELTLGIDGNHADEKENSDCETNQNANDEHEEIEELPVLVAQGVVP